MLKFAGISFDLLHKKDIFENNEKTLFVVTANAEIISKYNEDESFKKSVSKAHFTFDGQIPFALAKFKTKRKDIEKISGSDLIYDISRNALNKEEKVFLLGGLIESNALAVKKLAELFPGLKIAGFSPEFSPYPFRKEINEEILNKIEEFKPDYLFVGFGAGKQEAYIADHLELFKNLNIKVIVGSGGTFEFVSGKLKRAPKIIQKVGLEGLFRLLVEPKFFRLKRLLISFKIFRYYFKD